ncbi:shikimate dehydrogenase [Corynebacterium urogenitale]
MTTLRPELRPGIPSVLSVEEFLDTEAPWRAHAASQICAVLGRPIEHSLSPLLHNTGYEYAGIDSTYVRVEAGEGTEIRELLQRSSDSVRGFSVTMPGKAAALELSDVATERATRIGSANTLVRHEDGWLSDNTDVDGVTACLEYIAQSGSVRFAGSSAVVVGNGGTARPAVAALAAAGVEKITVLARSERALNLQSLVTEFGIKFAWKRLDDSAISDICAEASSVISTIPAHSAEPVVPALIRAESIIDVIYDPYPTPLLKAAAERGLPHADGLRMLAGQAERQFEFFTGQRPPEGLLLKTVMESRQQS